MELKTVTDDYNLKQKVLSCRYEEICGYATQPNPEKNEGALAVNFATGFADGGGDANYLIVRRGILLFNLKRKVFWK